MVGTPIVNQAKDDKRRSGIRGIIYPTASFLNYAPRERSTFLCLMFMRDERLTVAQYLLITTCSVWTPVVYNIVVSKGIIAAAIMSSATEGCYAGCFTLSEVVCCTWSHIERPRGRVQTDMTVRQYTNPGCPSARVAGLMLGMTGRRILFLDRWWHQLR